MIKLLRTGVEIERAALAQPAPSDQKVGHEWFPPSSGGTLFPAASNETLVVLVRAVADVWESLLLLAFTWVPGFFPYARESGLFRVHKIWEGT